ncbi:MULTISPECIES: sodium:calcium antiporter [unclassified Mycoplasma]|uniref:sodium:calcium antiporter n=1 Tax=unclassified Mycoplasma TaxID=2683645 RepID=UPI000FDEFA32
MAVISDWISSWSLGGKLSVLWFLLVSCVLVWCSFRLVQNLGVISNKSNLNDSFLGGTFVAVITSTPELVTEISSALLGKPEIGLADDMGSNSFSIFLVAVSAIIFVRSMFLKHLNHYAKISLWMSAGAIVFFTVMVAVNRDVVIGTPGRFAIGIVPLLFFLFWVISLWVSLKYGDNDDEPAIYKSKDISLKKATFFFVFWGLNLIVWALVLNWVAQSMADGYNLTSNVVGGVFLSISTSLPEASVFVLMLRKRLLAAATLSIIGSHLFNLAIPFVGDMIYTKDAIFNQNPDVSALLPLSLQTSIMIILLAFQATFLNFVKKKRYYLVVPSLIASIYIGGWVLMAVL